jgi:hypothetical protein
MASSSRKQTMAKMARQRALQERREAKQLKKDEKRRAAAERKSEAGEPAEAPETGVQSAIDETE